MPAAIGFHIRGDWAAPATDAAASLADHVAAAQAASAKYPGQDGAPATAAQVFLFGARSGRPDVTPAAAAALGAMTGPTLRILSHCSYLAAPWQGKPFPAALIRAERRVAAVAGCEGVVVHLGRPDAKATCRVLPELLARRPSRIARGFDPEGKLPRVLLEPSGHIREESSHYHTPGHLEELLRRIREGADPPLRQTGLCIDTAHLWSNGVDISGREAAAAWTGAFSEALDAHAVGERGGWDPTCLALHLNDSGDERGGGRDRHAPLCEGSIWSGQRRSLDRSGLLPFLQLADERDSVVILERHPREAIVRDFGVLADLI